MHGRIQKTSGPLQNEHRQLRYALGFCALNEGTTVFRETDGVLTDPYQP